MFKRISGIFGSKTGKSQIHDDVKIIQTQKWELGYKSGISPCLYVNVDGLSSNDHRALLNSLAERDISYQERTRSSGTRILECVMTPHGNDFKNLAALLGEDRMKTLENESTIKNHKWEFGLKGGDTACLFVNLDRLNSEKHRALLNALAAQDISYQERTRSSNGTRILECIMTPHRSDFQNLATLLDLDAITTQQGAQHAASTFVENARGLRL